MSLLDRPGRPDETTTLNPEEAITVVIPAYNEEIAVRAEVETVRAVLESHGLVHEIVVVDDGSKDRTVAEALRAGARVLQHLENRGYGASLKTGIDAARYEIIVIIDADGTYPANQIPAMVTKLKNADMVVGARTGEQVHIPWQRRPAKAVLRWLASYIAGRRIPDLNSGLRAFRRECVMQYFPILSNRFSFTTTVSLSYFADDYRIVYHPIDYHQRVGRSKIVPRHFLDFIILILRITMLFQPLKIFVPLGFSLGLLGIVKTIFDVFAVVPRYDTNFLWTIFHQPVISTSAILALLLGFQLLLIGMMADGVVRRIAQHAPPLVKSRNVRSVELPPAATWDERPEEARQTELVSTQ